MTGPLVVLAAAAIVVGFLGAPQLGASVRRLGPLRGEPHVPVPGLDGGALDRRWRLGHRRRVRGCTRAGASATRSRSSDPVRRCSSTSTTSTTSTCAGSSGRSAYQLSAARLLDQPARPRRRRQRRRHRLARVLGQRAVLVRPAGDRRRGQRRRRIAGFTRRALALHPVRQRPALRAPCCSPAWSILAVDLSRAI